MGFSFIIDYSLDREAFMVQVDEMVQLCKAGKVFLPLNAPKSRHSMAILLSAIDCDGCNASCCKANVDGLPIPLMPSDERKLAGLPAYHPVMSPEGCQGLPLPCSFLVDGQCSIYHDRPIVCIFWPVGEGRIGSKSVIGLDMNCPSAEKLARKVFATEWLLRNRAYYAN
jgi:Fe-S-cluster containining protein